MYEIDISMSPATIETLKNEGYALYGFKVVQTAAKGGAPLVWFKTTKILTGTKVLWEEAYQAYVSTSDIITNGVIDASTSCDITLGQTAEIDPSGVITSSSDGTEGAISINNLGTTPYTAGISQMTDGIAKAMCAIPLHGMALDEIVPIEKVLLMFASNTVNTGTVIYKSFSPGLLVDLTAAPTRPVAFDIDLGWSWGTGTWAIQVAAEANLVPLLITD
ncbi:MAG: hypothetical protein WC729_24820 [Sphingomonas sp.]|jgi:hypothetical protein|uniref:hypothetical protein n=1 Tax=Sphingomonas sp. TaxID=28214 RepID=UPI003561BE16